LNQDRPNANTSATGAGQWLDGWLHPEVREGSALGLHQARTQTVVAAVGAVGFLLAALVSLIRHAPGGDMSMLTLDAIGVGGCALVVVLQRIIARPDVSGNLLSFVTFIYALGVLALTGGLQSPAAFWMPLTPLVAFVTVGWRSALAWLGIGASATIGIMVAQSMGVQFPNLLAATDPRMAQFVNLMAIAVMVFSITFAWDRGQRAVIRDLQDAHDAARSADAQKSNVVAIVSHELRTPMNGVLGMLDLLRDTDLDDTQMRYASTARGAARSLLDILDDLLDRSRIDAGRLGLESVTFRVLDVVEDVENLVNLGGFGQSVPVRFEVGDAVETPVIGDPRRLRQIITNLVGNALKFTEEGEVVVRAHGEPIGERIRIYLQVADTGIGIAPDRLAHVFDPFVQGDGTVTRRFGGTGLGLSITRDLVDLMGGRVSVKSRSAQGTTFSVELPLPIAQGVPDEPTEPSGPQLWYPGRRVLVAEDNNVNQMVIRGYLQRHGIDPMMVEDGEAAVLAALAEPFDLLLMDCEMPVMDGFAATQALRQAGYTSPIVALTAHASNKVRARCMDVGMDGFLTKPIGTGAFLQILSEYLGARQQRAGSGPSRSRPAPMH
jgi:signal transduction histidine kinase/ActR/RegA family two-component response regulator